MANKKQCINSGLDFSIIKNFNGDGTENAQMWFQKLEFLLKNKNITDESACSTLPLLLNDNALNWFISLPDNVKENFIDLKAAFLDRYGPNKSTRWFMVSELYKIKQEQNEKSFGLYKQNYRKYNGTRHTRSTTKGNYTSRNKTRNKTIHFAKRRKSEHFKYSKVCKNGRRSVFWKSKHNCYVSN